MNRKIDLSIIILSWNTKQLLKSCLESMTNDQWLMANTEIIVVDNGSSDGSREYLKKIVNGQSSIINHQSFRVIFNDRNLGFAKGNNQGIKQARGKYILLLNSDTLVLNKAIQKSLNFMHQNPRIDISGCKLLNKDKTIQPSVGKFPSLGNVFKMLFIDHLLKQTGGAWSMTSPIEIKKVDWVAGAFLMTRKEVFDQIGGLDENIFMYFEEVEWCYRAKQAGKKIYFYPNAKIIHLGGGSSPTGKTGQILHIYQGLVYFYQKHKPKWKEFLIRLMLKAKAASAYFLGLVTNNSYLKKTYGQAFKLV